MGRTVKDSSRLRKMANVYEIVRRQDESFDIFHNGDLEHSSVPDRWLEDELAKHGVCGSEYREVRHQLNESGKARLTF
jgi:hypothetical protein